jgi:2-methylcitrate dehydratase PrpD
MNESNLAYHFANWACELSRSDIPDNVYTAAHRAMLDTLGVTLAGRAHPDIKRLSEIWPASNGSSSLVTGGMTSAEGAALLNASAAHVWDFDDTSYTGIMHGSALIFPVVLALAQELGASDKELHTSFIIGSEIAYVLADICTHQHYFNGWWGTATFGLVGATAAAARLLGCSNNQMAQAIGLAAAAAGGGKSVFGTSAKPFLVGDTAQRAISFARIIAAGLSGPVSGFEGKTGFLHLLNNDIAQLDEASTLGQRWRLIHPGLLVKRYPVCSGAHAAIEEVARLTFETGLPSNEIEAIFIEVPELVRISLVHDAPKTPSQAQFSLPFAVASAILYGGVGLGDLNNGFLQSSKLQALMRKVKISVADDLSTKDMLTRFPESARIKITLKDGTIRKGFCGEAYGMPGRPISEADFWSKFQECLIFADCPTEQPNQLARSIIELTADLFTPIEKP